MSESEAKTAQGTLSKITKNEETGWYELEIDVGRTYPLKIRTMKAEIVDQIKTYGRQPGIFHYTESEGKNINPHTNEPYRNKFADKVEPLGSQRDEITIESSAPAREVDWDKKDRIMARESVLKSLTSAMSVSTWDGSVIAQVLAAAEAFETWIYRGFEASPGTKSSDLVITGPPIEPSDEIPFTPSI